MAKKLIIMGLVLLLTLGLAVPAMAHETVASGNLGGKGGYYCAHPDVHQPALYKLSLKYDTPYAQVLSWFCDGHYGVGEIMKAFVASRAVNGAYSPGQILAMKTELGGWGKVWKALGLIAKGH